jgi:hypothetical protein
MQQQSYRNDLNVLKQTYPSLHLFDTENTFCDSAICRARLNNQWLYIDTNHISIYASNMLLNEMQRGGYLQ